MANSIEAAFENLSGIIAKKDNYRWDMAIGFLELLRDAPVERESFINELFNLTIQNRAADPWAYDGIYRLYNELWTMLNSEQKETLYSLLTTHYNHCKHWHDEVLPDLYFLSDDIHRMILWQLPEFDDLEKVDATMTLLSMHKSWITASDKKPLPQRYDIVEEDQNATWENICISLKEQLKGRI